MLSTCCAVPAGQRVSPSLARHETAGSRRIRGEEVSGPERAAAGAVGAADAKAAVRRPLAGPRAGAPPVIREGNLVTEGDDLPGAGCRRFAPNADSARLTTGTTKRAVARRSSALVWSIGLGMDGL